MKRVATLCVAVIAILLLPALGLSQKSDQQTPPGGGPPPGSQPPPLPMPQTLPDSIVALNDSLLREVTAAIAGREKAPAESVFKSIKTFKGVPAERIPRAMAGFSRAIGASCFACHTKDRKWESEDNVHKDVARLMVNMVRAINDDHLSKSKELEGASVSCWTCHRGHRDPNWENRRNRPGGPGGPPTQGQSGDKR